MAPGETRTVVLTPEKAYGEHDPDGVQIRMRDEVPDGHELEVGAVLAWRNPIPTRCFRQSCRGDAGLREVGFQPSACWRDARVHHRDARHRRRVTRGLDYARLHSIAF